MQTIEVPRQLFRKTPGVFCARIALAVTIILVGSECMMSGTGWLVILGALVQGAMYVHLIELQHSVLHLHFSDSHRVNRVLGVLLGLPMLISFSDFQYKHLRHHKHLGTMLNTETFTYQHEEINSPGAFAHAMFDYSRCVTLAQRIFKSLKGETITDGRNAVMEARVRYEYRLFALCLFAAALISIAMHNPAPILLWLAPLIAAEPIHFLLELPEHLGLPAHSNPNVFENTRTWGGSWFARWYSHNTNFHIAHHFNQLVPMDKLPELQKLLDPHIPESSRSKSYPDFFMDVIWPRERRHTSSFGLKIRCLAQKAPRSMQDACASGSSGKEQANARAPDYSVTMWCLRFKPLFRDGPISFEQIIRRGVEKMVAGLSILLGIHGL